jgi:RimJ/RimL family protein N-acetyltransferase
MSADYDRDLPEIGTERLRARPLRDADAPALFAIFREPEVARFWSSPPMHSPEQARELIDDIRSEFASGILHEWGIELREQPGVIGTCSLSSLSRANRRGEIGFALHPSAWGRGLIAEMLPRLLDHAFDDLGLHRIEADVDPRNSGSLRALERLGFRVEGRLRDRWQATGEVQDSLILGLLEPEWRQR